MPRVFNRVIEFRVEGEIYDSKGTTPESIIKNYNWGFQDNEDGTFSLIASHKDNRGRITKMTHISKIKHWRKPDTEFFIKM